MTEPNTYQIVTLPKLRNGSETESRMNALAEKLRALRLRALQVAPEAFAAEYELEKQRRLDQTLERLNTPKAIHFIATSKSGLTPGSPGYSDDVDGIVSREWLGMIVLLGPQEDEEGVSERQDPFARMTADGTVIHSVAQSLHNPPGCNALHFHLNGMFVDLSARRGGLGKALIDAALRRAEAEACKASTGLRVTISVYDHNVAARKLYERSGFEVIKEEKSRTKPGAMAVHLELSLAANP